LRANSIFKKLHFLSILDNDQKSVNFSAKHLRQTFQNFIPDYLEETSQKKIFIGKTPVFLHQNRTSRKKIQPIDKSFRKDFEKSNLCVQRKILRVFLINHLFYLFQTTSKKFKVPVKNFSKGLSKSHSTCRQEFYEEKSLFSVRKLFHRFRILSEKVKSFGVVGFFARMKDAWKVL